jgi:hypothetical protein
MRHWIRRCKKLEVCLHFGLEFSVRLFRNTLQFTSFSPPDPLPTSLGPCANIQGGML